jgi:CRISPR-associated endonuclease Csn1
MKNYRLGIDMGSTSLGWSILELNEKNEPKDIIDMGVRIFPDGRDAKTKEPLNVTRRDARGSRINRDRYIMRRKTVMSILTEYGLMPKDEAERKELEKLDPYLLRVKALDEEVSLFELGRAIFHLNQRRGFKSNRKTDSKDDEASVMKTAIKETKDEMENSGARTFGEYLYNLNTTLGKKEQHKRKAMRVKKGKKSYNLYPDRSMYRDEFNIIWSKQKVFQQELTGELKEKLGKALFFQRDLRPMEKGRCQFEPEEFRASFAYVTVQKFRIHQEINNLVLLDFDRKEVVLSEEQRAIILHHLLIKQKPKFTALRKKLGKEFAGDYVFNLESEKRKDMKGDETSFMLRKPEYFGEKWDDLTDVDKDEIIRRVLNEDHDKETEDTLIDWLKVTYKLKEKNANNIFEAKLPNRISNLSLKAINNILPHLKDGFKYDVACIKAGYEFTDDAPDDPKYYKGDLPYYGELFQKDALFADKEHYNESDPEHYFGKIPNVSVHIALNQLRKFINALTLKYGAPKQIVLELARELKHGKNRLDEINKIQTKNRKENVRIGIELEKIPVDNNYLNRTKYKLWEELNGDPVKRCCPFSGKHISIHKLFTHEFQIEHILPKSRTFNDRMINKTIAHRDANQFKGEQSPYEAFGNSLNGYDYNAIIARTESLPRSKRKRFYADAMKNYEDEGEVLSRMLTDTQYMSRIARKYMAFVCGKDNVWSIAGQLTAKLRSKWGLNNLLSEDGSKNRADHRHHAIDAFVVACTSRSTMQKAAKAIEASREKFLDKMPPPFREYSFSKIKAVTTGIIVSYKPDHMNAKEAIKENKTVGQLHKDTAYGYVGESKKKKGYIVLAVRKELTSIDNIKNIEEIADNRIREELLYECRLKSKAEIKKIVSDYSEQKNINRVKCHIEKQKDTVVKIADKYGNYKYYELRGNYCADIYRPLVGKKAGKWQIEVIPKFYAHQKGFVPNWVKENPTAKRIMSLYINDVIVCHKNEQTKITRVKKMGIDGRLYLVDLSIATFEKEPNATSVKQLQEMRARKVKVDILGNLFDPMQHK